ncbi:DUF2242 domain-containing protein [Burkholderia glumae]|uniref:DUF2242 domain-containing protein n=1 Tax=Burkholderia glumae TaxID=337 RepID=UPI0020B2B41C|nr:DUF2242 domain-containing protein [Burkholderia glumae]
MHNRSRLISLTCALAASAVLAACSSAPKPLYTQEQFDASSSPYTHTFHENATATCEAARRALLSQGYITNLTRPDTVDGSKNFQPNSDSHVTIEFHVVCVDADADSTSAIAYVNAVQDRYTLKKATTSASVGLSVLGSVSLPIGSSDDSMVKIASETIPAGVFYDRFFKLVDHFLKVDPARHGKAAAKAAEKEPVAPLPEPAPSTGAPGDDGAVKLKTPAVPTPSAPAPVSGLAPVPVAAAGGALAAAVPNHTVTATPAAFPAVPPAAASPTQAATNRGAGAAPANATHDANPANPANPAPSPATGSASGPQPVVASTGTSAVTTGSAARPIATPSADAGGRAGRRAVGAGDAARFGREAGHGGPSDPGIAGRSGRRRRRQRRSRRREPAGRQRPRRRSAGIGCPGRPRFHPHPRPRPRFRFRCSGSGRQRAISARRARSQPASPRVRCARVRRCTPSRQHRAAGRGPAACPPDSRAESTVKAPHNRVAASGPARAARALAPRAAAIAPSTTGLPRSLPQAGGKYEVTARGDS